MKDYYFWTHGVPPAPGRWAGHKVEVCVMKYNGGPTADTEGVSSICASYVLTDCHSREELDAKARGLFYLYCTTHGIPVEREAPDGNQ